MNAESSDRPSPATRGEERVRMSRLRERIAQRMLESQATTATLTTVNEIDMSALQRLQAAGAGAGAMAIFVKAAAQALKKYPVLNASVDGADIVYHLHQDIGIATATPRGLIAPIVRDAAHCTLAQIEQALADLAARSQSGKIRQDELAGGTFTLSHAGTFGTLLGTPIINPPQSAILGLYATQPRPVALDDKTMAVRPMKYIALSYDHRIIDGREAALWLLEFKSLIERPQPLLQELQAPVSSGDEASSTLLDRLAVSLANVLRVDPQSIDPGAAFVALGLTSIAAVAWIDALNRELGTRLSATVVYAQPTLRSLGAYLASREIDMEAASPKPVSLPVTPRSPGQQPIAIIGASGRYAGARSLREFWTLLKEGRDAVREVPPSRWDSGKTTSKWLGCIDKVECFDPLFFDISPADAELMDPQQRLFLQEAYRALEDAGYAGASLDGARCGVYFGLCNNDYATMLRTTGEGIADRLGNSCAIASARIAYHLNLRGPAITIDTACSSSLVALHMARQALLANEIDMAIVGAATLFLAPELYACWSAAGMLANDGRCKTFDERADGFVAGEGVGAVVLKRLSDAERDADNIQAMVVATALNQDGKTNGITAPSLARQSELIADTYRLHGIAANSIDYLEAHGTGTQLGDPIELEAASAAFGQTTSECGFCVIGSVKSNIGHAIAAAGMAGLHKIMLCMAHRQLVPTLHFETPNPHFDFARSPFHVGTEVREWKAKSGRVRRAALSAFGISGTNGHVVIDEYVHPARPRSAAVQPHLFMLSARTAAQLRAAAADLQAWLVERDALDLADVAFTLRVGRAALVQRAAFIATTRGELFENLSALAAGRPLPPPSRDSDTLLRDMAQRWMNHQPIDHEALLRLHRAKPRRVSLPPYPFAEERYWAEGIGGPICPRANSVHAATPSTPATLDESLSRLLDAVIAGELDLDTAAHRAQDAMDDASLDRAKP